MKYFGAAGLSLSFFLFILCPGMARAETPHLLPLMLPAACAPGQDCWVVNYTDMNPAIDQAEDYTCNQATYDGHEGTDFGLRDLTQMKSGVSVLAVAPGKVTRVRDGIVDRQPTKEEIDEMLATAKGCGNGILIDHGNEWQSIYCQLKQGSITVRMGDTVTAGQKIAEIGQSGAAEFPHLHFGLFHKGKTTDPFSSRPADEGCGKSNGSMWMTGIEVDYDPMAIFADGFTTAVPDFAKIRENAVSLATTSPAIDVLAYWVGLYGMHTGDKVVLTITAPDGTVFATQTIDQKEDRSRQFYFVGRKIGDPLLPGAYTGNVTVERSIPGSSTEKLVRKSEKQISVLNPIER